MWGVALFTVLVLLCIAVAVGMHYILVVQGKHGRWEVRNG